MDHPAHPRWLVWAERLQAIAQNGLAFAQDKYDVDRYAAIREVAAEMLAVSTHDNVNAVRSLISLDTGYATPKVDVRGVVFREGKILLVRERSDGRWALPGGWADLCASPAENVVREIEEESGLKTRAVKVLAVFDRAKHTHEPAFPFHVYKLFIMCSLIGGNAAASGETNAAEFFAQDELPELSETRVTVWQINRMFAHHQNPNLPTDFDQ